MAGGRSEAAFSRAVAYAPSGPGVYFFLGDDAELLYVGKAANLRARLRGHGRDSLGSGRTRLRGSYARIREVRWEEASTEEAALLRESTLIVALRPPLNSTLRYEGRWSYLVVDGVGGSDQRLRFEITNRPVAGAGRRVYGCFPHLGPGLSSAPGIACSDGFTSLLRLLWASNPNAAESHIPRRISATTPPALAEITIGVLPDNQLHAFLSGRSRALLGALSPVVSADDIEQYMRPALGRDVVGAEAFFLNGPQPLRALRLRHRTPAGPMSAPAVEALLVADLRSSIGDFDLPKSVLAST